MSTTKCIQVSPPPCYDTKYISQGFLQPDGIGGQCDPYLTIIGHCGTVDGHTIHMLQNKD